MLALVGESGSGKSVTALALMQLLGANLMIAKGEILLRRPRRLSAPTSPGSARAARRSRRSAARRMGMIFQEPMSSFSPIHTIGQQIAEVVTVHEDVGRKAARARAAELLAKVGIPDPVGALDRYPSEFSGGMRQRAMIARALICGPSLLIADEPTTALDVTIQGQILELLRGLQRDLGMAILFITHDLGIVAQMADRVADHVFRPHRRERRRCATFSGSPAHPYTRALLDAVPRLGDLDRGRAHQADRRLGAQHLRRAARLPLPSALPGRRCCRAAPSATPPRCQRARAVPWREPASTRERRCCTA